MQVKSIITKINEINKKESEMQYIRVETNEGNEVVFWGSLDSCVNLHALEKQEMPVLISCEECDREKLCTNLLGEYFSVHEQSVITIHPYDSKQIKTLMSTEKDTDRLVKVLQNNLSSHG
jgi:hypothetical protein